MKSKEIIMMHYFIRLLTSNNILVNLIYLFNTANIFKSLNQNFIQTIAIKM